MTTRKTTIVLADDHRVVLEGLRVLLETSAGIEVVGEASNGFEAIALAKKLKPDVIVMDLMMPELGGFEALSQIHQKSPEIKIIILSMHENDAYVLRAMNYGAAGYVLKDSSSGELVDAIHSVMKGNQYFSPSIEIRIYEKMQTTFSEVDDPLLKLTRREREVFQMVSEGNSSTIIANKLGISSRTVESHRGNLMKKLGLRSQTDIIRLAIKAGVISLDE